MESNLNSYFAAYPLIANLYRQKQVPSSDLIQTVFSDKAATTYFYRDLAAVMQKYAVAYYEEGNSSLPDWDYDFAYRLLETLSEIYPELKQYSKLTETVGSGDQLSFFTQTDKSKQPNHTKVKKSNFTKEAHQVKMESLKDLFSKEELFAALDNMRNELVNLGVKKEEAAELKFTVEEKIDGLSLAVLYEHGQLTRALTRGNGLIGDNVTANALMIKNLPAVVPSDWPILEFRGEVYMPKKSFQELNNSLYEKVLKNGGDSETAESKLFANARNACVGSLKQKDPQVTRQRNLAIFAFNLQRPVPASIDSHQESLSYLQSLGLPVVYESRLYSRNEDIYAACSAIMQKRDSLPYGIDGAVIKLDKLSYRLLLGSTSKTPRWAFAYKFPPEQVKTKLLDIAVQVGRSGKLTPLAILAPVYIQGSTVRKASLHNFSYPQKLDLRIGDEVFVHKAGDIIPEITGPDLSSRPPEARAYVRPDRCPVCQSELLVADQDSYCLNVSCPKQILLRFAYFTGKEAMNITNLGEKTLEQFISAGFLHTLPDIYRLQRYYAEVADIRGFAVNTVYNDKGEKTLIIPKFDEILQAISRSKSNSPTKFLIALGLPELGVTMSTKLQHYFPNLQALFNASSADLLAVPDIGEKIAGNLLTIFQSDNFHKLLQDFATLEWDILTRPWSDQQSNSVSPADFWYPWLKDRDYLDQNDRLQIKPEENFWNGKKIVFTGTFRHNKRSELALLLQYFGAVIQNSLTKQTNYLIIGEEAGSKQQKAAKMQIPCLTEAEFWQKFRK